MIIRKLLFAAAAGALLLSGCMAKGPKQPLDDAAVFVWPEAPQEPRYAYIKSTRGEEDYQAKGFWDWLFGAPPARPLRKPTNVFAAGNAIYISQTDGGSVAVFDATADDKVRYLGAYGRGKLQEPQGVSGTADGSLVCVADSKVAKVYCYDQRGSLKVAIGDGGELVNPTGVAVNDALKRIYVLDSRANKVFVHDLRGAKLFEFGREGFGAGEFYRPFGLAIDRRNGNVLVSDTLNFRVQQFDKDGKFLLAFGENGDYPGSFTRPKGVGVDSDGNIYVVDASFNNVQVFSENFKDLLIWIGGYGEGPGNFSGAAGMYIDDQDRIYIADSFNRRVQVIQYLSEKWKKAHPGEYQKYQLKP